MFFHLIFKFIFNLFFSIFIYFMFKVKKKKSSYNFLFSLLSAKEEFNFVKVQSI